MRKTDRCSSNPNYSILDPEWNALPSTYHQSYKFVLFEERHPGDLTLKERFLFPTDVSKRFSAKMDVEEKPLNLLRTPFKQILKDIEDEEIAKEKERNRLSREGLNQPSLGPTAETRNPPTSSRRCRRLLDLYEPKAFTDLIGDQRTNRFALKFLKAWEMKTNPKVTYFDVETIVQASKYPVSSSGRADLESGQ
jgi:hypothetical protein